MPSPRPAALLASIALVAFVLPSCQGEPAPDPSAEAGPEAGEATPPARPTAYDAEPRHDRRFAVADRFLPTWEEGAPHGPLPGGAHPVSAELSLTVDPRLDSFGGTVTYTLRLDAPTDTLWMHGERLTINEITVAGPGETPTVAAWVLAADPGVARVDLRRELGPGEVTLHIDYAAAFDTQLSGLFKVVEHGHPYALAKSESIQARKYLPGFDEPRYKTRWTVELAIPSGMTAIANAPLAEKHDDVGDLVRWRFEQTPPLPTYLLSLSVGPFARRKAPDLPANSVRPEPVPLQGYARPGQAAELQAILDLTPELMAFYEEAFGLPYPYRKLDIVAAPAWPSGATELSGAITYRESRVLLGRDPSPAARRSMESVHAHELTHMWFGNLVTPPWWEDLWLKEGFATWGSTVAWAALEPEAGHELDALAKTLSVMGEDHLRDARAVKEPIWINQDIRNAYDGITYSKGRAVITMLDAYFTPEVFRPALGRFLEEHADGTADAAQFYEAMAAATGEEELVGSLRSFVEQPGVPVVELEELRCEESDLVELRLTQRPYRPLGALSEQARRWVVPLCVELDGERRCTLMDQDALTWRITDQLCPTEVRLNPGGSGYYRIALPAASWEALVTRLPALPAADALVLLASAEAQHAAGELEVGTLMALFEAAARHTDRRVVVQPLGRLRAWDRRWVDAESRPALRAWVAAAWGPRLEAASERVASGTATDEDLLLQTELLSLSALTLEDRESRALLVDRTRRWAGFEVPEEREALLTDHLELGLTVTLQDLGEPFLRHLLVLRTERDDARLGLASAAAMGRMASPAHAEELRALALSGELDPRESWELVAGLMAEPATAEGTWIWLQRELDGFAGVIPSQWRRRVPGLLAASCEPARVAELEVLLEGDTASLLPGHGRPLALVTEEVAICAAQAQALAPALRAQLASATEDEGAAEGASALDAPDTP